MQLYTGLICLLVQVQNFISSYLSSFMSSRSLPKLKYLVSKELAAMNEHHHFQRKYHKTEKELKKRKSRLPANVYSIFIHSVILCILFFIKVKQGWRHGYSSCLWAGRGSDKMAKHLGRSN